MATITFRAKVETLYNVDRSIAYAFISVPTLKRRHCFMEEFRKHSEYGAYANSDIFDNILATIKRKHLGERLRLDSIPANVSVDTSGFLAIVTLTV